MQWGDEPMGERGCGLTAAEREAMREFEEAMLVITQALRKLRTPYRPGLSENAMAVLGVVHRLQPTRASDLAAELGLAVSTVSRKLEPLVRQGWVDATPDPEDQRVHLLSLTRDGCRALRAERRRKMTRYVELLDEETRSRFPEMARFFTRVAQSLHDAAERPRPRTG